jgi:hypothetical protein
MSVLPTKAAGSRKRFLSSKQLACSCCHPCRWPTVLISTESVHMKWVTGPWLITCSEVGISQIQTSKRNPRREQLQESGSDSVASMHMIAVAESVDTLVVQCELGVVLLIPFHCPVGCQGQQAIKFAGSTFTFSHCQEKSAATICTKVQEWLLLVRRNTQRHNSYWARALHCIHRLCILLSYQSRGLLDHQKKESAKQNIFENLEILNL